MIEKIFKFPELFKNNLIQIHHCHLSNYCVLYQKYTVTSISFWVIGGIELHLEFVLPYDVFGKYGFQLRLGWSDSTIYNQIRCNIITYSFQQLKMKPTFRGFHPCNPNSVRSTKPTNQKKKKEIMFFSLFLFVIDVFRNLLVVIKNHSSINLIKWASGYRVFILQLTAVSTAAAVFKEKNRTAAPTFKFWKLFRFYFSF